MTVNDYAAEWLIRHPRPSDATDRQNGYGVKAFVAEFGRWPLHAVGGNAACLWAAENPSSVRYARAMMEDARRDGLIYRNPFAGLHLPQSRGRADIKVLTPDQLDALEEAGGEYNFGTAIVFAAYTGVRVGEQLGLTWGDWIKDKDDELLVERSLRPDGVIVPVKGYRSRIILVPEPASDLFRGKFFNVDGTPSEVDPQTIPLFGLSRDQHRSRWEATREDAGLEDVTWHELRHHAATWLLEKLLAATDRKTAYELVARQLGHSSTRITEELYVHLDEARERDRLRSLLAG